MRPLSLTLALVVVAMSACHVEAPRKEETNATKNVEEPKPASGPTEKQRWDLASGPIAYSPICENFRAPELPNPVPDEGVVPAFLFSVGGAPPDEVENVRSGLMQNGFAVGGGTVTINGTEILFAAGNGGVLKTQEIADRLFDRICGLNSDHVKLVAARYNDVTEANRMN
jgi:hypothetical protein